MVPLAPTVMSSPLVSVLVRTYQSAATVELAVASALAQTYENLECLVVDDGSTDGTEALIGRIQDRRVRYIRHSRNRGRAAAAGTGINQARGQYLGIVDADDWWYPDKLTRQLAVLEPNPELALVSTNMTLLHPSGAPLSVEGWSTPLAPPREVFVPPFQSVRPVRLPYGPSLFRMDAARSVRLDTNLRRSEDSYFMLQLLLRHPCAIWTEPLYSYTVPGSDAHLHSARAARAVYAKYLLEYPLASARYQLKYFAKEVAYRATRALGIPDALLPKRGRPLSEDERRRFESARHKVESVRERFSAATAD